MWVALDGLHLRILHTVPSEYFQSGRLGYYVRKLPHVPVSQVYLLDWGVSGATGSYMA